MKKLISLFCIAIVMIVTGCSVNDEAVVNAANSGKESYWAMYHIGLDKHITKVYSNSDAYSYKQVLKLMKEDLASSDVQNYDALNSFWYDVVCSRVRKTFTDGQKWEFLSRETDKEGLLPFYGAYYSLLASCKEFKNREQMDVLANKASANAHIIINSMQDEAKAKSYNNDLIYAQRMYGLLIISDSEKSK